MGRNAVQVLMTNVNKKQKNMKTLIFSISPFKIAFVKKKIKQKIWKQIY